MKISQVSLFFAIITAAFNFSSCTSNLAPGTPNPLTITSGTNAPPAQFQPAVIQSLKFSKAVKIDFEKLKKTIVKPLVQKLNLDNIPLKPLDSTDFKPFSKPVTESKFDYNALPEKNFDLDKLPSKQLKFKTYLLPPPKLIKAGLPRLKNAAQALYEFGEAQGLPGKIVSSVLTDHYGFLWIATLQGLYRYDGENLLLYIPGPLDHAILDLTEDDKGRIWMVTEQEGIQVFDPKTALLKKTDKQLGLGSNLLPCLMLDKQQRLWASTNAPGGVDIIDTKTDNIKRLNKKTACRTRFMQME